MVIYKIRKLYDLALAEGEGLGTAYEYHVKLRLISGLLEGSDTRSVLIYGLPEKYGFSLDFFYLCSLRGYETFLFENRNARVSRLFKILESADLPKPKIIENIGRSFDLVLSSEVLQSVEQKKVYIDNVKRYGRISAIFVPNKDNRSHSRVSGLSGFTLGEMKDIFGCQTGHIDIPPFPPGVKKRKQTNSRLILFLLAALGLLERFYPLKKRLAHMVYSIK